MELPSSQKQLISLLCLAGNIYVQLKPEILRRMQLASLHHLDLPVTGQLQSHMVKHHRIVGGHYQDHSELRV